jgi:tripartite-type tricarboxylate transporter receptor subunit TctC
MARPDVQARVATLSVEPDYTDEKAFGAYLLEEVDQDQGNHQGTAAASSIADIAQG